MAKNMPTLSFCSITTIIVANITAGFHFFSLLSIFTPATNQPDEVVANENGAHFFLWCMRLQRLYDLPNEEFDSHWDKWNAIACYDTFRLLQFTYEDTGRLPPDIKKASYDQTFADIHICGLDSCRCSNQTMELMFRYHDELPCAWQEEIKL